MTKKLFSLTILLSLLLISISPAAFAESGNTSTNFITLEDGTVHTIASMNEERTADSLSIFTRSYGTVTPSAPSQTSEAIIVNGIITAKYSNNLNGTYIPSNGYVLSGTGSTALIVDGLMIGESITSSFTIPILPEKYFIVNQMVVPVTLINAVRGEAAVVLYDPTFGPSTNANPWGMELTVVDGIVTNVVTMRQDSNGNWLDNNSIIPPNGYVLSIHNGNVYHNLLSGSVQIGDELTLNLNNESLIEASKTSFDAFNPSLREHNPGGWDDINNTPYPGFRGTNQLIIYDRSYGTSTGTNPWGYEVVVGADGKVIQTGGNDSAIPEGGYVVSGHGIKASWLTANVSVGSTFILYEDKKQALFMFTPESYLDRARLGIEVAEQGLQRSKELFLDVDYSRIEQQISLSRAELEQLNNRINLGDFTDFTVHFENLNNTIQLSSLMNYESRAVDHRAVWLRPKERTVEQVRANIEKLSSLNINSIYLETWWDGYTIFPTSNPYTIQNPMYQGFDVLDAYIKEAHAAGIELHAWVENIRIGENTPIRTLKPEWAMITRKGHDYQYVPLYGFNYYFLTPVHPEVRDFISDIYEELIVNYDVDGLHLDYIRYPGDEDYTNDFGFDPYSRQLFEQIHGVDPIEVFPGHELWPEWANFKKNAINELVYRISSEAKALKPEIKVSAAVWPNYAAGPEHMSQETSDWLAKNQLDQLFPMSYNPDAVTVERDAINSVALANNKALVIIGVGTYINLSKEMLIKQIVSSMAAGNSGSALFEFESLFENKYDQALLAGVYSKRAIVPDKDPHESLSTIVSEMKRKITTIYVPNRGLTDKDSRKYLQELDKLAKEWKHKKVVKDAEKTLQEAEKLIDRINRDSNTNVEVKNRMIEDLNYMIRIISVYLSKAS